LNITIFDGVCAKEDLGMMGASSRQKPTKPHKLRRRGFRALLVGCAIGLASPALVDVASAPAAAQSVYTAILVNDVPISNYDINARAALLRLQGGASSQAEEELIDEALQRAEARRLGISVTQAELDQALQTIASRSGLSVSQLGQALSQRGVDLATLRDSIEAQMLWDQVIRARFQATVRVDEQDVLAALDDRRKMTVARNSQPLNTPCVRWFSLFQKVRGSNTREQRRREAAAFRSRFESCASGISTARQLNGVVIQNEVTTLFSRFAPELAQNLNETPVGRLTPPEDLPKAW
jgi:peptidyl-prolyl cis-trans isomerase SurA